MNKERLQERIEKCRQILEANPRSQIFAALAEAHRKLGDLKAALDVCSDGLKIHPDYGSAYLVLAKIARDQKRYPDAERAIFKAIELDGPTRSAEILLSDIYLQTGKFRRAEDILARLAEADPLNKTVHRLRGLVRKAGQAAALAQGVGSGRESAPAVPEPKAAEEVPPAQHETAPVAAPPEPARSAESLWEATLAALDRYPHLIGKLAVGYDGMLLNSDLEVRSEAEIAAAMAADLIAAVHGEWPAASYGSVEQVLVETDAASWWIWPFPEFLLVLWCDPNINMGPLRIQLRRVEASPELTKQGGRT